MNLIVGKNNTGKTTLLEALRIWSSNNILGAAFSDACSSRNLQARISSLLPKEKLINHKDREIFFEFFDDDKLGILRLKEQSTVISKKEKAYSTSFIPSSVVNNQKLMEQWHPIYNSPEEDLVIDALKIIEPKVKKFGFTYGDSIPQVLLENDKKPMPIRSMGEGMTRTLQLIISAVQANEGILLIDEFENGLHYSIQEKIWKLLLTLSKQHNIQIFATTHSLDTVNSFRNVVLEQEEIDTGAIIRLGHSRLKANLGQIISTVYNQESLQKIEDMDLDIR
jgi:AAA15 family ATPase/GTPase